MLRAAIVGGGPAGSAAAFHLALAGADVVLVEARAFPRPKTCGEFVSPSATAALERILPPPTLARAGARRVDLFAIEAGGREVSWRLPSPAWALSRASLDPLLLDAARASGARVLQPALVRCVRYEAEGVRVGLADGRTIDADVVVHADGIGRHDPAGPVRMARGVIGRKCHLRVPGGVRGVRIRAATGAYVGTIELEHGMCTCALAVRHEVVARHAGDADAMLCDLWPGFDPAWRVGEWMSCGLPRSRYVRPGHVRSFRAGNAAAAVDPIGGEGIGLALWSGEVIAKVLSRADAARPDSFARAQSLIAAAMRRRLWTRLPACRAAAGLLEHPSLAGALFPLLFPCAGVFRAWYALSGKPLRAARPSGA
jgi:hypothetical protein